MVHSLTQSHTACNHYTAAVLFISSYDSSRPLLLPLSRCFALQIVVLFLQLALLGAAVGLGFGLATSLWLSRIFNDPGLEIILTFGAAYSCYFVAEELLGASGLLAVVVMGFSMSLIGALSDSH